MFRDIRPFSPFKYLTIKIYKISLVIIYASFFFFQPLAHTQKIDSGFLHTKDNTDISYERHINKTDSVIIICPGFYNGKDNKWMQETVKIVSPAYDVIIFDFRGHGQSSGKFTWSAREDQDVSAVIDYAKSLGYKHIGIIAFSLGAAASINAVADRDNVDSMVLVSCPSSFRMVDYHFWEQGMWDDLFDNINNDWQGKGARCDNIFIPKKKPFKSISAIKNTPILFIQGDSDWVVKPWHTEKLFKSATGNKKMVIIEKGPHAERLVEKYPDLMKNLILDWFKETLNK